MKWYFLCPLFGFLVALIFWGLAITIFSLWKGPYTMIINKNNLNVWQVPSKEDNYNRKTISGVYFDKDQTVATNSNILVKVGYPDLKDLKSSRLFPILKMMKRKSKPFLLVQAGVKELQKNLSKNPKPILDRTAQLNTMKTNKNGSAFFATTNLESHRVHSVKKADEEYPNYKQVFWDESKAKFKIALDPCSVHSPVRTIKANGSQASCFCIARRQLPNPD